MYGIAIAQVRANARRLTSTGLAVVVGVAFLAGTLILGNTLNANFERLFTDVSAGTDVVVRNATAVDPTSVNEQRGPIPASTVDAVARVPGVAVASAQIEGYGALVGANGEPIGGNGPPRQAASWITEPSLNPYRLVEGRAPVGPDEVVVNRGAATAGHLHLGDTTTVRTPDPVTVTIVGIATFGDEDGFGQTTFTAFTLAGAERHIFQRSDEISSVVVKAAPGDSAESLRDRIAATLPPGTEAITGSQLAAERIDNVSKQFLDGLRTGLTGFALIALLVASITISNTFSITLAQRSRELALVRAVGASRRQVRRSVALEAFVVGCACAAVGVAAGFGLAGLLKGLFDAAGFALPAGGLTVSVASLVVPFVAGVAVTVIAALVPARRAVRVSPVAALSDAEDTVDTISYRRIAIGTVGMGLGVVAAAVAEASGTAALFALGAVALIAGAVLIAPVAVVPATTALGRVLRVTRRQTAATELAIGNARHRARRTAATATALLVGATVVTIVTVFITSVQTSIGNRVQSAMTADLAVSDTSFGGGRLSPQVIDDMQAVPGVGEVVGLGGGPALVGTTSTQVVATDLGRISDVVKVEVDGGNLRDAGADPDAMAVNESTAQDHGWSIGSAVPVTFADGTTQSLSVRAVFASNELVGAVLIPQDLWNAHTSQPRLRMALVDAAPNNSTAQLRAAVQPVADRYGAEIDDPSELASATTSMLDVALGIVYVLLALAVLVALLGIANALSLAVHERRREIGLLRAVGQTRRGARRTIRLEAVMISAFGSIAGIALGTFLGWSLFGVASTAAGFTIPVARLGIVAVIGTVAGIVAARRPSKRAARLAILDAIATQ